MTPTGAPRRANHHANGATYLDATGRGTARLAGGRRRALTALVAELLAVPQPAHQQLDNPVGAPACVAVRG